MKRQDQHKWRRFNFRSMTLIWPHTGRQLQMTQMKHCNYYQQTHSAIDFANHYSFITKVMYYFLSSWYKHVYLKMNITILLHA